MMGTHLGLAPMPLCAGTQLAPWSGLDDTSLLMLLLIADHPRSVARVLCKASTGLRAAVGIYRCEKNVWDGFKECA